MPTYMCLQSPRFYDFNDCRVKFTTVMNRTLLSETLAATLKFVLLFTTLVSVEHSTFLCLLTLYDSPHAFTCVRVFERFILS